jgi:tetratricopeptide (TPR) repeat protein
MAYQVVCTCGKTLSVSEDMADSAATCDCGRTVQVPSLHDLRMAAITAAPPPPAESPSQAITEALPAPLPPLRFADDPPPGAQGSAVILTPTRVTLWTQRGALRDPPETVMAALTEDALWIQNVWELRKVPLQGLGRIEACQDGAELTLAFRPGVSDEQLRLAFVSAAEGQRWHREIQARQQFSPGALAEDQRLPEGVALVRRAPAVPHEVLGRVGFTGETAWAADRGLQLHAGMLGADAVLEVHRERCAEVGWGARHASGLAVRVEDPDVRKRLRLRWYFEEMCSLVNRTLLLLLLQAAAFLLLAVVGASAPSLQAATGLTPAQTLLWAGLGLALLFSWPLLLVALLRALRWPQLLRAVGLAVLVATTGRGLAVWVAHLLAWRASGAALPANTFGLMLDPVQWAFLIAGILLCVRAWRLARDARHILPREVQSASAARRVWAHGLFATTAVYALALLAFAGVARFQETAYLLQPGIDSRREQQALLAFNDGLAQANKGDLAAAERSWQQSLRLWEQLTAGPNTPPTYRSHLVTTLHNLGWLRLRQNRDDEAEAYYARAVAVADALPADFPLDAEFRRTMAGARAALAGLRGGGLAERQALQALNQGVAHLDRNDLASAEQALQLSLRLWEKLAAANPAPPAARGNLGLTLNNLGWIRRRQGRADDAEKYFTRVLELANGPADGPPVDPGTQEAVTYARKVLAELRGARLAKQLGEKEQAAARAHEEADIKAQKQDADAERLYAKAIALWEEILPQITNEVYRKGTVVRLATACSLLGQLQQRFGKRAAAEATLTRAIDYGEKALAQDPERPLLKHNLELARQLLDGSREQALQEEVSKLWAAKRFAEALDRSRRGVEEQQELVRAGKGGKTATRRLAYRLTRFAWLLAHCPDGGLRDTKAAVAQSRRAAELQPEMGDCWYTLALVQYRNGDWRDSLKSLEKLQAQEGAYDGSGWLLVAMNRHQLKQREEARAALRKGVAWIEERRRQAEGNAVLRSQFELMRLTLEALRREAESLIEGKGPAGNKEG